jgi:hypothetical protein
METFDGWLLSCLDTLMMKYQYDQASIVTSTPLAGLCCRYVEEIIGFHDELSLLLGPDEQSSLLLPTR